MKNSGFLILSAILSLLFISCSNNDAPEYYMSSAVLKNGNIEYWQQIGYAIRVRSVNSGLGSFLSWVDSDDDADGQLENIDTLSRIKDMRPLGLIIAPVYNDNDHRVEESAAAYARKNNIQVVVIDTPVDMNNSPLKDVMKCYVGTDNAAAGKAFAQKVSEENSSIVAFLMPSSQAAVKRYEAFVEEKGTVDLVYSDEKNILSKVDSVKTENPSASTYVFFNGSLCNNSLKELAGKNVYTFDIYKDILISLRSADGSVKGIMAQDTFSMGQTAVLALSAQLSTSNIYIDPLYITKDSINNDIVVSYLNYYGI